MGYDKVRVVAEKSEAMKLKELVDISSGRTFKNGIPVSDDPTHSVIQLRDVDTTNDLRPIRWEQLGRTNLSSSKVDNSLKLNDVLIVAKGSVKKAIYLDSVPKNIVANQHFFVLRVQTDKPLLPDFLAHYLNSSEAQRWMSDNAGGSYQSAISKEILSKLPLPAIDLERQRLITEAANSIKKEMFLHQQLMKSREQDINAVFSNLWEDLK